MKWQGMLVAALVMVVHSATVQAADPTDWAHTVGFSGHQHVWAEVATGTRAYQIGDCDYTPPCVDHLWSGYSQNPHRCNMHKHHGCHLGCGNRFGGCGACGAHGCGAPLMGCSDATGCTTVVPGCSATIAPTEAPVPVPEAARDESARRMAPINRYKTIPASYGPSAR